MLRDSSRLNGGLPTNPVNFVSPIVCLMTPQFSPEFYADMEKLLLAYSKEAGTRIVREMGLLLDKEKAAFETPSTVRAFSTEDWAAIKIIAERATETVRPEALPFLVPAGQTRGTEYITANPAMRVAYVGSRQNAKPPRRTDRNSRTVPDSDDA